MPLFSAHPLFLIYKMKTFNYTFGSKEIVTSLIINLLIEKDSSRGINSQIYILGLKTEPMAIKPWAISPGESLLILFVPQRITTFFTDERKGISLARQRTFSTRSPLMPRLMYLLTKSLFQTLLYQVRPATIESPIMMELMFSCLTWKQWFWWILSQLLL